MKKKLSLIVLIPVLFIFLSVFLPLIPIETTSPGYLREEAIDQNKQILLDKCGGKFHFSPLLSYSSPICQSRVSVPVLILELVVLYLLAEVLLRIFRRKQKYGEDRDEY